MPAVNTIAHVKVLHGRCRICRHYGEDCAGLAIGEDRATVEVDGQRFTGIVYHVRDNGWPCVKCDDGHIASGPEVQR